MRSGAFTYLTIAEGSAILKDVDLKPCLVGIPMRTADKEILGEQITLPNTPGGTNYEVASLDATKENGLKTEPNDLLTNMGEDGSNLIDFHIMNAGDAKDTAIQMAIANGFLSAPAITQAKYNVNPAEDVIAFKHTDFIKQIGPNMDVTFGVHSETNKSTVTVSGADATAFIKLVKKGMVVYQTTTSAVSGIDTVEALITSVNVSDGTFTIDDPDLATITGVGVDYYGVKNFQRIKANELNVSFSITTDEITVDGTNAAAYVGIINDALTRKEDVYIFDDGGATGKVLSATGTIITLVPGQGVLLETGSFEIKGAYVDVYGSVADNKFGMQNPTIYYTLGAQRPVGEGLNLISTPSDIVEIFDSSSVSDINSNLAFSAGLASTQGLAFYIYGLKTDGSKNLAELMSDLTTWSEPFDDLMKKKSAYHLVPLTNDASILSAYNSFVELTTQPDNQSEKRLYASRLIVNEGDGLIKWTVDDTPACLLTVGNIDDTKNTSQITITGDGAGALYAKLQIGDVIQGRFNDASTKYEYVEGTILSLDNASTYKFTVDNIMSTDSEKLSTWNIHFPLGKLYSKSNFKSENDTTMAVAVPIGYNSELTSLITPYYHKMGDYVLEGYHVAAITAAEVASKLTGYDFTNETVSLLTESMSLDYFTDGATGQKERLKNSGFMLIDQANAKASPYFYHQATTNVQNENVFEMSLNIVHHTIMRAIRDAYKGYIARGLNNRINPNDPNDKATIEYNKMLGKIIAQIHSKYAAQSLGTKYRIAAAIRFIGSAPSTTNKTLTNVRVEIEDLYPVNRINTYILAL